MTLQQELIKDIFYQCLKQNFVITSVESCTGGLISSAITAVPGSSEFFHKGLVTYSNESKIQLAGVSKATIERYGAVSHEVVSEMAKNLIINDELNNQISIATSGVAGPGQSEKKPVGLIWLASYRKNNLMIKRLNLGNLSRDTIRRRTVLEAFRLLQQNLTRKF